MKTIVLIAYFFSFAWLVQAQTNLLSGWDGNGDANVATSYPDQYGWAASPGSFNYANSSSGVRWTDVTASSSPVHTLNGNAYTGRLLMVRWDGAGATTTSSVYSFPVSLEANKRYRFSGIYEWWNNASTPTLTFGISYDRLAANNLTAESFVCGAKNQLLEAQFDLYAPTTGTYYFTVKSSSGATLCAIGNLQVSELPAELGSSVSSLAFNFFQTETTFGVTSNGSADPIYLSSASSNLSITPASLPAEGGTVSVSVGDRVDFSGSILITQGSDQVSLPVTGSFPANQQPIATHDVTNEGAWCWFADPRALRYTNEALQIDATYIGYIDVHGAIKARQLNHKTNEASETLIRSYFQPDDHNNPTFLALPDGRIMIFYARHTDEACFYYRVSQKPGDITTLGKEVRIATANNTTYPSPFILSDDPNHIYLCWRGIGWHPTIGRLPIPTEANNNEVSFNWGPCQIVRSKNGAGGVRPYAKYASNGKDQIYLTYTTTHPDNQTNNWVYFNTIDVNSKALKDATGKALATVGSGALHDVDATDTYYTAHPNAVVDRTSLRDWVWEVAMDSDGKPVIAMVRISSDKTSHDYYYAKWTGSEWQKIFLENGGGHFHQTPNLEMCYSGGMAIDKTHPNILYCSVPVEGKYGKVYEIKKYTIENGALASVVQLTGNSEKNNVRPYVIPNTQSGLVWMYGDYYDWIVSSARPKGFPTGIRASFEIPKAVVDLAAGLIKHETFDDDSGFQGNATVEGGALKLTANASASLAASASPSPSFTIVLSPYIDNNRYYGKILTMGKMEYGLGAGANPKPYLVLNGSTYNSTNALGNSDVWKTMNRSTGGEWPTASKFGFFSLALTYENGTLKTYINGLADQYIEMAGLSLGDIDLGGFSGWINDLRVYNRNLSQDEIKALADELAGQTAQIEFELEYNALNVPSEVYTDRVLKTVLSSGETVAWTSSNEGVLSGAGLVNLPATATNLTLTASVNKEAVQPKTFNVTVMPRNIEKNKTLHYRFETDDLFETDGVNYVWDKSGNGNHAAILGNATVNGVLDLTQNTASGFSTNGYAMAPNGILDALRSYTFLVKVNPTRLDSQPRIYDFGSAASNSVFARLNGFCAGLKYNNGTTVLLNSASALPLGQESKIAVTFDAASKTTRVYLNAEETVSGTTIVNEPYQLSKIGANTRNYIGRAQWWDTSTSADNVDYCGTIDDFYLFDIALTKEEIISVWNAASFIPSARNQELSIYPNGGELHILSDEAIEWIEIYASGGQILGKSRGNINPVSISKLSEGVYIAKIQTSRGNFVSKFIKKYHK